MGFENSYEDARRAAAYDKLEFGGTYHLAFRDLPGLISANVDGRRALDFGCGTGRTARLLKGLGFDANVVGRKYIEHRAVVSSVTGDWAGSRVRATTLSSRHSPSTISREGRGKWDSSGTWPACWQRGESL